jgi:hypothetical protein
MNHLPRPVELPVPGGRPTLVDSDVAEALSGVKLAGTRNGYVRLSRGTVRYLHRFICRPEAGQMVHHCNGLPWDNRRCNLRCLTAMEHSHTRAVRPNRLGFRGVVSRGANRFYARLTYRGKVYWDGSVGTVEEAAVLFDRIARRIQAPRPYRNFTGLLSRRRVARFLEATGGRFFSVSFRKRSDGSFRRLLSRTGVHPTGEGKGRYNPAEKGLLLLWDLQRSQWRAVPLEGVILISCRSHVWGVTDGY